MTLIAPSILAADFARLGEEVRDVTKAGADFIHIDVMDGHFVPNLSMGPVVVEAVKKHTNLPLDVHLMIAPADPYIESFAKAGADIIYTMLNKGRDGTTQACRELGIKEIGNVTDWVAREPDVFIGSAWADVGIGVFQACQDLSNGHFKAGRIFKVGLGQPEAVRLIMTPDTPEPIRRRIAALREEILNGTIQVEADYTGPEFQL